MLFFPRLPTFSSLQNFLWSSQKRAHLLLTRLSNLLVGPFLKHAGKEEVDAKAAETKDLGVSLYLNTRFTLMKQLIS